jgi:transcription elongation factor SPT6
MVVVDRKGEVMTQQVFNYLTLSKQQLQTRPDLADLRKSESDYLEAIFQQYQPDLIVISANQPECLRIRADLREQWANQRPWISVADTTVPHIFSLSDRAQQQLPETPAILREAISLARLKLNPLAEILNVWSDNSDENGCLHIQLHPMQRMVP